MNRLHRSHRSTKVPNVKLRPAPAPAAQSAAADMDAEDDAHFRETRDRAATRGAHSAADFHGEALRPLRDLVMCFNGISEKVRGSCAS